jgi:hypothetical protein
MPPLVSRSSSSSVSPPPSLKRKHPDSPVESPAPKRPCAEGDSSSESSLGDSSVGYLSSRDGSSRARMSLDGQPPAPGGAAPFPGSASSDHADAEQLHPPPGYPTRHEDVPVGEPVAQPTPAPTTRTGSIIQRVQSWLQKAQDLLESAAPQSQEAHLANPQREHGLRGLLGKLSHMVGEPSFESGMKRHVGLAVMERGRGVIEQLAMHAAWNGRYNQHLPDLVELGRQACEMRNHALAAQSGHAHWPGWGAAAVKAQYELNRIPVSHRISHKPPPDDNLLNFLADWPPMNMVMQARCAPMHQHQPYGAPYGMQGQPPIYQQMSLEERKAAIKRELHNGAGMMGF